MVLMLPAPMDTDQSIHNSTSRGSLHHSYRTRTTRLNTSTSCRKPLGSVHENITALRSPGSLESMLKTTTETSNLGLYSIRAQVNSNNCYQPLRSRPSLPDPSLVPLVHPKPFEDEQVQNEHKWAKSHRDTTSEIISLYASDHQPPHFREISASTSDDLRSKSMINHETKQNPSKKISSTTSRQLGTTALQRPRSPYPYPTRLRRPGIRAASPALGENGAIDYSRMVELDRDSQRTGLGLPGSSYPLGARLPPPLPTRNNCVNLVHTLSSNGSSDSSSRVTGKNRTHTLHASQPWSSRHYEGRREDSMEQSLRSSSLTSIVGMYQQCAEEAKDSQTAHRGGQFYYDYSEHFNQNVRLKDTNASSCFVPRGESSMKAPTIFGDGEGGNYAILNETQNDFVDLSDSGLYSGRTGVMFKRPLQRAFGAKTTDNASLSNSGHMVKESASSVSDDCNELASNSSYSSCHDDHPLASAKLRSSDEFKNADDGPVANIAVSQVPNRSVTTTPPNTACSPENWKTRCCGDLWRLSKTLGAVPDGLAIFQGRRTSQISITKLKCTLDPTLSEFASLFSSFDRLAKSPFAGGEDFTESTVHGDNSELRSDKKRDDGNGDDSVYQRRHRRNLAAMRISKTPFSAENAAKNAPVHGTGLTILSPEPISPARQLRVKNSIPRLMKALPPLPPEGNSLGHTMTYCHDEQGLPSSNNRDQGNQTTTKNDENNDVVDALLFRVAEPPITQFEPSGSYPPRLRLRTKPSLSVDMDGDGKGRISEDKPRPQVLLRTSPVVASKPKLKLKISRSQLGQGRFRNEGGFIGNNRLKQCNSLADLAFYSREHALSNRPGQDVKPGTEAQSHNEGELTGASQISDEMSDRSPQPSDQFNIPYPPSPEKAGTRPCSNASTNILAPSELRSLTSEVKPVRPLRLRQKLSIFRLRGGAGSHITQIPRSADPDHASETQEEIHPLDSDSEAMQYNGTGVDDAKIRAVSMRSYRRGGRVKRWASGAKRAVRLYVRKTLDRPSRLNN